MIVIVTVLPAVCHVARACTAAYYAAGGLAQEDVMLDTVLFHGNYDQL